MSGALPQVANRSGRRHVDCRLKAIAKASFGCGVFNQHWEEPVNYIEPHMTKALADHVLERIDDNHMLLRRPGTGMYSLNIAQVAAHLVLVGDLTIGGPHGCVSTGGYDFAWFSRAAGTYLCSKFLAKEWQWEVAKQYIQEWIADDDTPPSERDALQSILVNECWEYGSEPMEHELYERLYEIDQSYIDDGLPGRDYNLADAGWLCAAQQRFAELYLEPEGKASP